MRSAFPRPIVDIEHFRLAAVGEVLQIADTEEQPDTTLKEVARRRGYRSILFVPLNSHGSTIGTISLTRRDPGPFAAHHVQLIQTFADQAVIAIENTRLFNETREALERQTATAEILKVIASSPDDVRPVFEAIATSANRLIGGFSTAVFRFVDGIAHLAAFTPTNPAADEVLKSRFPRPISEYESFDLVRGGEPVEIPDTESSPELRDIAQARGYRSMLFTPLVSGEAVIGMVSVTRRQTGSFASHHVQLLRTFADQAVIAIENVRLFDEVQARTRDLAESLQQQTATAQVLEVISRSAFDLHAVFATVVENSVKLCDADRAIIFRYDGKLLHIAAAFNTAPEFREWIENNPIPLGRHSGAARAALERRTIHIPDVRADPEYVYGAKDVEAIRTILGVPILKGDNLLGVLMIFRLEVNPFAEKQIALVETFADQAAIAIENSRLFDEVQARTEDLQESLQQQTATADVLKVISRSAFDLPTVLQTLVESAVRLSNADNGTITRQDRGVFYRAESFGFSPEFLDVVRRMPVEPGRASVAGRALLEGKVVHIPDVLEDPEYTFLSEIGLDQFRTAVGIPMLREGVPIGVLTLSRANANPFTGKELELVTTFADQAAIAIENVRLFESVEARTRELAESLEELRAAQDRLVQTEKLASLGQLTAGIAHEIKNPLNFVNNFSALSVELIDEMTAVLENPEIDETDRRKELDEIRELLKGNLQKVVQHGKRADSIVKNMLLHSRQGSGEHRPVDINAIVDESLNLAYHGARAENTGFNITMRRSFDPEAGMAEGYPQEITRALLNLISNGFYAASKRKLDAGDGFEPTLSAATKNLGDKVEIRICDNGTGIPSEVKDKIFNPFFTTKPAGEGTGLGLSMSHDIIVKQHGGTIDVDTAPDAFTEFRIVLPRTGALLTRSGEQE